MPPLHRQRKDIQEIQDIPIPAITNNIFTGIYILPFKYNNNKRAITSRKFLKALKKM